MPRGRGARRKAQERRGPALQRRGAEGVAPRLPGLRLLPRRHQGGASSGEARSRRVRLLPRRRAEAVRGERARPEGRRRRLLRAGLQGVPRHPQHPAPFHPRLADVHDGGPAALRQLPPGRHDGQPDAPDPADQHPGELHGQHPRRGPLQEGPDRGRGLHELPHGALRAAAHGSPLLHRQGEHREDVPALPRADRDRAPQGDSRRALGEAAAHDSGLRGLPLAAQGAEGVLHAGHGRPGLPALPRQPGSQGDPQRADGLAVHEQGGAGAFAPREDRLRAVPHRRRPRRRHAGLPHDRAEGRLLDLPRRGRRSVPGEQARPALRAGQPGRARVPGLPQSPRDSVQERLGLADLLAQRAGPVRELPSDRAEGRRPHQGRPAAHRRKLPGEHPRQGTDAVRPHGHGQLRRLPHRPPRAPGRRSAIEREPRQRRPDLLEVPSGNLRALHRERPFAVRDPYRQGAARLQRLPFGPQHPADGPLQFPPPHHGPVRPVSREDRGDLLRYLPRKGLQARIPDDGEVLRLPRRARHPARDRPAFPPLPDQHRQDLRQVPHRLAPAVRRLSDARHAPRSEALPVPLLHVLGDDDAAGRDTGGVGRAHGAVAGRSLRSAGPPSRKAPRPARSTSAASPRTSAIST